MKSSESYFLDIDDLSKRFGQFNALSNVSIGVEESGFLVLVGPSGCGKSTLLNMIAGFEPASEGDIRINGRSITHLHPSQRDIAMVFQSYALYPNMSVADNIGFGMETRGIPKAERLKRIDEVAGILQIEPLLKRKPSQLSGGQRQRVAMGRALVRDPQVFLFDEPLSNLDARLRVDMRVEIKKLHSRLGTTIVYVTHDQVEAMTLATRIAVLDAGKVQQLGTPDQIYNQPANTFVADFMGSPAMNRIKAELSQESGQLFVSFSGFRLPVVSPTAALLERQQADPSIEFGIRAEDISDAGGMRSNVNPEAALSLTVELLEPTGSDTFVDTADKDVRFTARIANNIKPAVGEQISLLFDMNKAHFFDPQTGVRVG